MDGTVEPSVAGLDAVLQTGFVPCDGPDVVSELSAQLGDRPFALIALFVSPQADFAEVMRTAARHWPDVPLTGCTTAGEISQHQGYTEGGIVAIAFPAERFGAELLRFDGIPALEDQAVIGDTVRGRSRLKASSPQFANEFAILLVDGLSLSEDHLTAALATGLGPMPMFGGSSGDGTRFKTAPVAFGSEVLHNGAVLAMLRTDCDISVFSLNNFTPTERRMVVTRADPSRRIVHEINAEPAARELGRLLGKLPDQIDQFTFAANPVVIRFGTRHHVRAIKRVTEDGALEFFSAIDEGVVMTIAEGAPMTDHLSAQFEDLSRARRPDAVIAFDCILRRIEAEQTQALQALGEIMCDYKVAGFSTYGEQFGGLHVNQTMTGVAFYAPSTEPTDAG